LLRSRRLPRRWPWAALGALSLGATLVVTLGSWQGCTIYGPELLLNDAGEAGTDGGQDGGPPPPPSTCTHALPPDRPDASESLEGGSNFSGVAAMSAIDVGYGFGTGDGGSTALPEGGLAPYGWDLDGVCTCRGVPAGPPSCLQGSGTKENCDDDAGRDHIALQLFRDLGVTAETESQTANQAMDVGQYGLLVQITGYNGMLDDEQVTVALYASNGVGTPDGGTPNATHLGNDKWTVDPGYITNGQSLVGTDCDNDNVLCVPTFSDNDAYVAGGVLVASFNTVPLTFGSRANIGGARMVLNSVKLVGTLVAKSLAGGDLGWGITNGSVSGRWETRAILANLSTIPDPNEDGGFFCGNDPYYKLFKSGICALQDINAQGNDNVNAPCTGLSMAFGFKAEPARLGPVLGVTPAPAGCIDDAGLPWQDTCP